MEGLDGSIRFLHCSYDGTRLNKKSIINPPDFKTKGQTWSLSTQVKKVHGEETALDIDIQYLLKKGKVTESGIAVAFDFSTWSTEHYVMLPAAVYNGNRCKLVDRAYATGLDRKYLYQKDIPLMSVPIPQLSPEPGAISRLEVNASNLATPAMCFFSKEKKHGFMVLTEQKTQYANNGFIVEESGRPRKEQVL